MTVLVIGDSILRSALKVVQARGIGQPAATVAGTAAVVTTVDLGKSDIEDWQTLLGDGSVRRLHLSVADINDAYGRSGNAEAAVAPEKGPPDDTFIDLYVAPATIPTDRPQPARRGRLRADDAGPAAGPAGDRRRWAQGRYSFKGSGYVRGGIFDRIELVQGLESVRFHDRNHTRIGELAAAGAPRVQGDRAVRRFRRTAHFDPTQPWQLKLLVQRAVGALEKAFLIFDLHYLPPEKYLKHEQPAVVVADAPQASTEATPGARAKIRPVRPRLPKRRSGSGSGRPAGSTWAFSWSPSAR